MRLFSFFPPLCQTTDITYEVLLNFIPQFFANLAEETLIYGNITASVSRRKKRDQIVFAFLFLRLVDAF